MAHTPKTRQVAAKKAAAKKPDKSATPAVGGVGNFLSESELKQYRALNAALRPRGLMVCLRRLPRKERLKLAAAAH